MRDAGSDNLTTAPRAWAGRQAQGLTASCLYDHRLLHCSSGLGGYRSGGEGVLGEVKQGGQACVLTVCSGRYAGPMDATPSPGSRADGGEKVGSKTGEGGEGWRQ